MPVWQQVNILGFAIPIVKVKQMFHQLYFITVKNYRIRLSLEGIFKEREKNAKKCLYLRSAVADKRYGLDENVHEASSPNCPC